MNQNQAVIELKDIHFSYSASTSGSSSDNNVAAQQSLILDIPSWAVPKKEKVFLHGASGAGKSTLLNLLTGMREPDRGEVLVMGTSLSSMSSSKRDQFRAKHIGVVFQQFNLIPYLSIRDNTRLAAHFSGTNDNVLLERIDHLSHALGVNEFVDKKASELSVGQQQRAAILRAMVNEPEIFIADEPTSALDDQNKQRFIEVLFNLVEELSMTLVLVSHDSSLAQYFSTVQDISELNKVMGAS
ncbi:ATP-binding cassette domain-containing protein [Marinibactrum halimedae]|uniref:ABC transporter ATP-binding protein n=1 Tax=Marinibactrum halimedae TaxID=1444977 RepID=A0AA37WMX4_9GAMM|nr:ATP-binding cassette domain-containing protein [Marinibactrum halimedae]MCD9460371.1 ATP-binding cassette domain-containing protein [Marinibactrum halimedae]GLS26808.1 ABC transporter ATP-binding protein [Marinibactrum halimedae]